MGNTYRDDPVKPRPQVTLGLVLGGKRVKDPHPDDPYRQSTH